MLFRSKPEGANWDWFIAAFRDCDVAMQVAEVYQVNTWSTMDDEYGFVLMPAGPKGQMATVPLDNIIVMPSCLSAQDANEIGFAYDLYTDPTPGYEDDDSWKLSYSTSFCDSRAVDETLTMMRDSEYQVIDYQPLIYGTDYGDFAYDV